MDGVDRLERRKSLTERLGLKNIACCGAATWGIRPSTISVQDEDDVEEEDPTRPGSDPPVEGPQTPPRNTPEQELSYMSPLYRISGSAPALENGCLGLPTTTGVTMGMNLAAALAAERQYRAVLDSDSGSPSPARPVQPGNVAAPGTPLRMSLLRLLEETDGGDGERYENEGRGLEGGCDSVCCVCMGRKRGAAFIPCGHTFCRICSRELWLNRGSCPLCNRSITEILDIY